MKHFLDMVVHLSPFPKARVEGFEWSFTPEDLAHHPTVQSAGFKEIKGTKLRANYWDEAWMPGLIESLNSTGKGWALMQNKVKNIKGSSNLFCMNGATFTIRDGLLVVDIDYRALNVMGPFLADLWLFNTLFNEIAEKTDSTLHVVNVVSARAFAGPHTSWRIFWFDELEPMERVELWIQLIEAVDPRYARKCVRLIRDFGLQEEMPVNKWRQYYRAWKAMQQLPPECRDRLRQYIGSFK